MFGKSSIIDFGLNQFWDETSLLSFRIDSEQNRSLSYHARGRFLGVHSNMRSLDIDCSG